MGSKSSALEEEEKDFANSSERAPCARAPTHGALACVGLMTARDVRAWVLGRDFLPRLPRWRQSRARHPRIPVEQDELADMAHKSPSIPLAAIAAAIARLPGEIGSSAPTGPSRTPWSRNLEATAALRADRAENGGNPSSSKDDDFYAQSAKRFARRAKTTDLLQKQMSWGIYREYRAGGRDGVFGHVRGHVVANGIKEYKRCHKWFRTAAAVLFSHSEVQVSRIGSPSA